MCLCRLERIDFASDFPEVEIERLRKKAEKDGTKNKIMKIADGLAARTYSLMMRVCTDLVHCRRPLRMAFNKWLDATDLRHYSNHVSKQASIIAPGLQNNNNGVDNSGNMSMEDKKLSEKKRILSEQLGKIGGLEAVMERVLPEAEAIVATQEDIYSM